MAAKKATKKKPLTAKQQAFVDAYAGNGTEAARIAGYKGSDNTLAQVARENLTKPHIKKAIQERDKPAQKKRIADREERQSFWSTVMKSKKESMKDRLKASELLGKSQADFIQKHEHTGPAGGPIEHAHSLSPSVKEKLDEVYQQG